MAAAALVSDSSGRNPVMNKEQIAGEEEEEEDRAFDMISLKAHLPQKRKGLSMYFAGRSRSFACVSDAKCVGDLVKPEIPDAKRRKQTEQKARVLALVSSCSPCVGV